MGGGLLALEEFECQPEGLISRLRGGVQGDCRGGTARRALLPDGVPDLGLAPLPALPTATTCPAAAECQEGISFFDRLQSPEKASIPASRRGFESTTLSSTLAICRRKPLQNKGLTLRARFR